MPPQTLIHSVTRSRFAWLLASIHAAWFLLAVANMSPPSPALGEFLDSGGGSSATLFAGRPFHFTYESIFLKLLIFCDLPSALALLPVDLLLLPLRKAASLSAFSTSYFGAAELFSFATCQWLLIGCAVQTRIAAKPWGDKLLRKVNRHFTAIVVLVILATIVLGPIVNRRSQARGFHHAGISFH